MIRGSGSFEQRLKSKVGVLLSFTVTFEFCTFSFKYNFTTIFFCLFLRFHDTWSTKLFVIFLAVWFEIIIFFIRLFECYNLFSYYNNSLNVITLVISTVKRHLSFDKFCCITSWLAFLWCRVAVDMKIIFYLMRSISF